MFNIDFNQFKKYAAKGNLIAVTGTILADLETPVSAFLKLSKANENAFLLESAEQAEHIGRFSVIGVNPHTILEASPESDVVEIIGGSRRTLKDQRDVTRVIEKRMKDYSVANVQDIEGFSGGYVGYLGYENVIHFEDVNLQTLPGPKMPDAVFYLCTDFVIFDHFRKQMKIVALAHINNKQSLKTAYRNAVDRIETVVKKLNKAVPHIPAPKKDTHKHFRVSSNLKPKTFEKMVKRVKEYIRAGDCIQVVLSQRFQIPALYNDFQIYRALRSINPSPYMFYFRYKKIRLVGASPEVLVKKTGQEAEVRPIAGTRPRGKTVQEDLKYEDNLKRSKKELAEHLMLVDLGRNDLGRVCRYETVKVKNYARVERYSHVMHLVSDVVGKLKKGQSGFDVLRATFPAGTVSGAPKIRAMEIINELEPERRGPYAGCVGYFGFNGDMDMCITIRTLALVDKTLYLQAGAGIVKDSNPAREYEETVNKAKGLVKAIESQERMYAAGH